MSSMIGDPQVFLSELIWTVISFFLLMFLLKRFLFTPVMRFTEERQARVDEKLRKEQEAREQAAANDERFLTEKAKCREEAQQLLKQSAEERDKRHAAALTEAKSVAAQALKDGETALDLRAEKTADRLQEATPELAELLTKRLLSET